MKKGLSSMLSLVMIITSIFVIPTMAQADENPVLPISGTTVKITTQKMN